MNRSAYNLYSIDIFRKYDVKKEMPASTPKGFLYSRLKVRDTRRVVRGTTDVICVFDYI